MHPCHLLQQLNHQLIGQAASIPIHGMQPDLLVHPHLLFRLSNQVNRVRLHRCHHDLSIFNWSAAYSSLWFLTAARTTSLSALSSSAAYSRPYPDTLTTAITTSLSAFNLSATYLSPHPDPHPLRAAITNSLSARSSAAADCRAAPQFRTAARTTSL
eukprot:Sspe_Gene.117686::Locus_109288_Transcript_1_1_Confidence_1.000_Length_699::g.117686::m.117686